VILKPIPTNLLLTTSKQIKPDVVVYGGRNYEAKPPKEKELFFRWWYGVNRETISVAEREVAPYHAFMTNNFLIPKQLFLSIKLDEKLKGYGHEDTLFGIELKKKNTVQSTTSTIRSVISV
jgi:hypothetical protein